MWDDCLRPSAAYTLELDNAVDPAFKVASLAMLAKAGGVI